MILLKYNTIGNVVAWTIIWLCQTNLNESINIVKTFKHNYRMKLFVAWEK